LGIYGAFGFGQALGTMVLAVSIAITTLNASKQMHKAMLARIMQVKLSDCPL
jgi:hypothetical protein